MNRRSNSYIFWLVLIVALGSVIFAIRMSGPSDLESYAQVLNVGYILDLMTRGDWLVQYDLESIIMSKPPLHTWLMAPSVALLGFTRLALALPSFLCVLGVALLVFFVGRRRFGELAGGLAALTVVLAPMMVKQVALVRTDPLFTLTISAAAFAAFFAWERGAGGKKLWLLFWLMAALATLTKGPLGIVLAAGGLLAHFWEKIGSGGRPPAHTGLLVTQAPGVALFVVLTGGWFAAAWFDAGQALIDKMFFSELVYHALTEHAGGWKATAFFKPTAFLLVRYLPFSLAFFYALWTVFRQPASEPGERRFERFLVCWVLVGLIIFSLVKHQRADHLVPLWPACALLAGRQLARLAQRVGKTRFAGISMVVVAILVGVAYAAVNIRSSHEVKSAYARELRLASQARLAAQAFTASGLDASQLQHLDTPATLQLYLGTYRPYLTRPALESLLASASGPVDVALGKTRLDELALGERYPHTMRIFRWPTDETLEPVVQVYRIDR